MIKKGKKSLFYLLTLEDPSAYAHLLRRMPFLITMPFHALAVTPTRGRERIRKGPRYPQFKSTQLKHKNKWRFSNEKSINLDPVCRCSYSCRGRYAQDSSPYVVGHWNLHDSFQDFTPGAPITTDNTDFTFLNPTDLTLTLEYAFFAAPDGKFCGCDRDTLKPNGRTRYTMLGEMQGGQFSTNLCPTQTEGELKSIVFQSIDKKGKLVIGDALQGGAQIHVFGGSSDQRSESNLRGVIINGTTLREMNEIHQQCVKFIGS